MGRENSYFYISGFISLFLFTLFLSLSIYMMISMQDIKQFALKKDNYISISISMPMVQTKSSKQSVIVPKHVDVKSPVKQKEVNIDNLFSDVWTKSIKKQKKEPKKIDKRVIQTISKKLKTSETNKVQSISKKVENINTDQIAKDDSKTSTASEVNEYLAKIQGLVYKHFYPPKNSQGHSVRAVIILSAIGKVLDFRILNYSSNDDLNAECDNIKIRLSTVMFPKNPENESGKYTIQLTSKE